MRIQTRSNFCAVNAGFEMDNSNFQAYFSLQDIILFKLLPIFCGRDNYFSRSPRVLLSQSARSSTRGRSCLPWEDWIRSWKRAAHSCSVSGTDPFSRTGRDAGPQPPLRRQRPLPGNLEGVIPAAVMACHRPETILKINKLMQSYN